MNYPSVMDSLHVDEKLLEYAEGLESGDTTRKFYDLYSRYLENCTSADLNSAIDLYMQKQSDYTRIEKVVGQLIRACSKGIEKNFIEHIDEPPFIRLLKIENRKLEAVRRESSTIFRSFIKCGKEDCREQKRRADDLIKILEIKKGILPHYQKIQNTLFSALEEQSSGMNCLKLMWYLQDGVLENIKILIKLVSEPEPDFNIINKLYGKLFLTMGNLIYREEKILLPISMEILSPGVFSAMVNDAAEYGGAFNLDILSFVKDSVRKEHSLKDFAGVEEKDNLSLSVGALNLAQLDLMLNTLPVDITFVDENDRVKYFSQGKERIFPRSPGIIGRAVQNCHPPKSMHIVQEIIDDFKTGKRDTAEFWITLEGRFIHIRYFAMFEGNSYRGVLEVSQDVTDIRALEGQKRLLD